MLKKVLLALDPSINFTGLAVFVGKELVHKELLKPGKESDDYKDKSRSIYNQAKARVNEYRPDIVVLEIPDHWVIAGYHARESGAMNKLVFAAGMLYTLKDDVVGVLPRGWKHQLPKEVVARRLEKFYPGIAEWNNNVADAVGIGHWRIYGKV